MRHFLLKGKCVAIFGVLLFDEFRNEKILPPSEARGLYFGMKKGAKIGLQKSNAKTKIKYENFFYNIPQKKILIQSEKTHEIGRASWRERV